MRLKLLFITIALFVVCGSSYGQLLQWNTFGNAGTETTEPSIANDANIFASNLTQGTITAAANGNRFGGSGWWNSGDSASNTLAQAVAGNDYIQFVVTPNPGYSFTPTSFVFSWDRSSTGPQNVVLRSSIDGFTIDLGTIIRMAEAISIGNTITISGLTNITSATTFRIYGYGATATTGTGGFDVASGIVNVQLIGTTAAAVPTQLAFVNTPATGTTGTPLSSFTVEARNAGNVLVPSFTGTVTLTKASGTGTMSGTLSANATAGVATFNNIAFNQASNYTVTAGSAGLTSASSGNVLVSNPSTNIFGDDGINFVGQINGYSQPTNCTNGDYRVLQYRKVNTTTAMPSDGRGQWVTTVNVQAAGGDVTPLNMIAGGNNGFLFTSGGGCGATGTYTNKWAFGVVGQGAVDAINGSAWQGSTDMGLNMGTAGRYTFVLKDNGYNGTGYYVGYTTNAPVVMTHNSATQRTLNNDGTTSVTATISATKSSQENFYVRYKTGSNDFSTGSSIISAAGSVAGTTVTLTIPMQADGAVVCYYIFSSTISQPTLAALSEGDKSYAVLNYADNIGNNYSYTALSLTPTVTSIVPTAVTGVTGQANNTGFKGQTITINGTNFQSNSTVTINGIAATSVIFINASQLTAVVANTGADFTGNIVVANPTPITFVTVPSFNFLGYISTGTGAINTTSNWLGGTLPPANSTVIIAHTITHTGGATTGTPFASLTIPSGGSLGVGSTGAIAVTNAITTSGTGSLSLTVSSAVVSAGSVSNAGTISWTSTGTLTINAGGSLTNTGTVTSGTVGNVVFAAAGTINGANPITFNNLTINGTTTLTTVPTINGTLQVNSGSSVTASPTYGISSTLVYNTRGSYAVSNEWTGNGIAAGSGIPQNVTIQNSTTLTMPNSNRGMAGSLNISSGNLTLNATSGDLYLAGSWTRENSAVFIPNGRAVLFNGNGIQTVTVSTLGTETFNFLLVQGSGTLRLANNVIANASSGLTLGSTHGSSTIDLNGQTLTLSGGGNLNLSAGDRFITSSVANGKLLVNSNTVTVTNGGNLTTSATATVDLQNGLNCGTDSLVTINGTLQINVGGFCVGNSPRYGATSLLKYNSNTTYSRQLEWTGNGTTAGTGIPQNVQISTSTALNYINAANSGPKGIAGNLTIDSGSSLIMNNGNVSSGGPLTVARDIVNAGTLILGQSSGDDLRLGGNFNNTGGAFNGFDRAIFFIRSTTGIQLITAPAGIIIPYIMIQPAVAVINTVQLATGTNLTISAPLAGIALTFTNATDVFDINSNTLTIGTTGVANTINGSGTFKGSATSNLTLLGTGSIGTLNFTPTFQNLGTLTMNRQTATVGYTMGSAVTINTALNLTNGLIDLGTSIMTLEDVATITGTPSANSFVIADITGSSGTFRKRYTATYPSFTFPIGDRIASADGAQYSPATVNFSGVTTYSGTAYINVAVNDNVHPNIDSSIHYITRYWSVNRSGAFTDHNYTFTGTYLTIDIVGTQSNSVSASWNGIKWTNGSAISANTLTISGVTDLPVSTPDNHFSAGNRNREINIKGLTGGTNDIVSGSATTNGLNNTLFLGANLGSSSTKDYEIQNLGIAALNLTGTPIVSIGGANPGDFTVTTVPSISTIIGGSSTTFIITFSPLYAGIRTAIVSIANNDSNENPYTFLIQGTGNCPTTTNIITPTSGPVGTEITINATANNLTGATITFNGVAATAITIVSSTQIKVLIPSGATSGNLITNNATGCQTTNAFTVIENKANSCQGGTVASDLFISEVTDSNYGGLSYVEIYNGTNSSINMNGYNLKTYSNGETLTPTTLALNNFSLTPGSIYVVALGDDDLCSISGGNGSFAAQVTGGLGINFDANGNDHIALFKGTTKIDSFGTSGDSNWATSSLPIFFTQTDGATFRRKDTATLPTTTYSNSDWNIIDYTGTNVGDCANNDYSDISTYNFISGAPPTVTAHPSYTPTCKASSLTVAGTEGYNGTLPADTKELTYKWFFASTISTGWTEISEGAIYSGTASATLNISNISSVLNHQYYCQIRENTDTCYAASNAVKITDGGTTTWNGSWSNGLPAIDKLVIIDANYNTSTLSLGSFSACSVVVNSGKTLTITENEYVRIQNDLTNNGTITALHNSSLVQVNDAAVNTGKITYERNYKGIAWDDYTYWSSPVAGQKLIDLSPETKLDKFFSFDAQLTNDWLQEDPATREMVFGKGYIIRAKPYTGTGVPPGFFTNTFIGIPHNGEKLVPIYWRNSDPLGTSNLIGNPYPSAIDAVKFLTTNAGVIESTIYFWTHATSIQNRNLITGSNPDGTPKVGTGALAYTTDDYASFNLTGGVATGNIIPGTPPTPDNSNRPDGTIAAGQAFFTTSLKTNAVSSATFNNSMRLSSSNTILSNSQFFKTKNPKTKTATIEKHRIWLNLRNTQGVFKQTLIGYLTDATNQYDNRFDGVSFDANEFADFYSLNQDKNLVIQGRALPFDENDEVPLGFRTTVAGAFTINIDHSDGALTNQSVFIKDKLINTIFDLRSGPYTFETTSGIFNDRFVLRYNNKTLGTGDLETIENQVLVSSKDKQIKVNSAVEIIDKVTVYDLLGRQLFKKEKVNNNELAIPNFVSSQQMLLVKVSLQNGQTITRKIMY